MTGPHVLAIVGKVDDSPEWMGKSFRVHGGHGGVRSGPGDRRCRIRTGDSRSRVRPKVVDGSTIATRWMFWRIWGVAAPETDDPEGREAKDVIVRLVDGRTRFCAVTGRSTWSRLLVRCRIGPDFGRLLVESRAVRDCPKFSEIILHRRSRSAAGALCPIISSYLNFAMYNEIVSDDAAVG